MKDNKFTHINLRLSRKEMILDESTLKSSLQTNFGKGEFDIFYICDICNKKYPSLDNLISIKCSKCDNYIDYCYNDHENIDINANLPDYCITCNKSHNILN